MKNKVENKVENKNQYDSPGRPRYEMKFPKGAEWTFIQLMKANGVDTVKTLENGKPNPNYGKGDKCTMLTLRKNLDFVTYCLDEQGKVAHPKKVNPKSIVVPVKGVTADPNSESGLGRRATLYRLRSVPAKDHTPKSKAPKADVTAEVNQVIEDAKNILAESTVSIPETTITPAAPIPDAVHNDFGDNNIPEVTPEPVAETPALVAPVIVPAVVITEAAVEVPVTEISAAPVGVVAPETV